MTPPVMPYVLGPEEGRVIRGPVGGPTRVLADVAGTGGSVTFLENVIPPGQGPPKHVHAREDELWFVRDGDFRFVVGETLLPAPAGAFVFVPRGTPHCFQNVGPADARILVMFVPGGMDRFFEQHAELPEGPVDPDAYARISADNGMTVVGPPLAQSHPT